MVGMSGLTESELKRGHTKVGASAPEDYGPVCNFERKDCVKEKTVCAEETKWCRRRQRSQIRRSNKGGT